MLPDWMHILTETGWKPGFDVVKGESVACWDSVTGKIRLEPVSCTGSRPYHGDLTVFSNYRTAQACTPDHPVYKRHRIRPTVNGVRTSGFEPNWVRVPASAINRWNPVKLPLSGFHHGPGIGGMAFAELLGWVMIQPFAQREVGAIHIGGTSENMHLVARIRKTIGHCTSDYREVVVGPMEHASYTTYNWYISGSVADRIRDLLTKSPSRSYRSHPTWELLWQMTEWEKVGLQNVLFEGTKAIRVWHRVGRYFPNHWIQALVHLTGGSSLADLGHFRVRPDRATTVAGSALKTMHSPYKGDVWGVKIPGGIMVRSGWVKQKNRPRVNTFGRDAYLDDYGAVFITSGGL